MGVSAVGDVAPVVDVTCAGNTAGAGPPAGNESAPGHAAIR